VHGAKIVINLDSIAELVPFFRSNGLEICVIICIFAIQQQRKIVKHAKNRTNGSKERQEAEVTYSQVT
jgi:hypothetical protein